MVKFITKDRIKAAVAGVGLSAVLVLAPTGVALANNNEDGMHRDSKENLQRSHYRDNKDSSRSWWSKYWWNSPKEDEEQVDPALCEDRQDAVNATIEAFKERVSDKQQGHTVYLENQDNFVVENSLEIRHYAKLKAEAAESNIELTNELDKLKAPEIDCEKPGRVDDYMIAKAKRPVKKALSDLHHDTSKISRAIIVNL